MTTPCRHLDQIRDVKPNTPDGCEECLAMGGWWVHLRLCLTCGHVGCCDELAEQARDEALSRLEAPDHQEPRARGELEWCYVDEVELEPSA